MKIARICLMIFASLTLANVCAAQCGPAPAKGQNKGMKAKPAAGSNDAMIIAQEQKIIDAIKSRNEAAFKSHVDVNGWVVSTSGPKTIAEDVAELFSQEATITEYKMEDPHVQWIDKDAAILTYRSSSTATYQGKTMSMMSYDTTVYARRGTKWVAIFHQSTEMPKTSDGEMMGEK